MVSEASGGSSTGISKLKASANAAGSWESVIGCVSAPSEADPGRAEDAGRGVKPTQGRLGIRHKHATPSAHRISHIQNIIAPYNPIYFYSSRLYPGQIL